MKVEDGARLERRQGPGTPARGAAQKLVVRDANENICENLHYFGYGAELERLQFVLALAFLVPHVEHAHLTHLTQNYILHLEG